LEVWTFSAVSFKPALSLFARSVFAEPGEQGQTVRKSRVWGAHQPSARFQSAARKNVREETVVKGGKTMLKLGKKPGIRLETDRER
jgi:hypothetical protein